MTRPQDLVARDFGEEFIVALRIAGGRWQGRSTRNTGCISCGSPSDRVAAPPLEEVRADVAREWSTTGASARETSSTWRRVDLRRPHRGSAGGSREKGFVRFVSCDVAGRNAFRPDEFKPAYLELKQTGAETFDVLWKVPALDESTTLAIRPQFPSGRNLAAACSFAPVPACSAGDAGAGRHGR